MRWLALLTITTAALTGCADITDEPAVVPSSEPAPGIEPPSADEPETEPTASVFQPDDDGTPSDAAVAADRAFRRPGPDHADCGVWVATSGWPTTFAPPPDVTDCIVAAAADGRAAQYTVTGRDFTGGMAGTTYRVDGPGEIVVIDYTVSADGTVSTDERPCAALGPVESAFDTFPACVSG